MTVAPLTISSNTVLPRRSGARIHINTGSPQVFGPYILACKPGDSFFLPTNRPYYTGIHVHNFTAAHRKAGKNVRITYRTVVENSVRGIRIWRII